MIRTSQRARWAVVASLLIVIPVLLLSGACSGWPPAHHTAGPPAAARPSLTGVAGLVGPVGPVSRSCRGIAVSAAADVQEVIDAHPAGTTFCLSAGTYRLESPLVPKRGDALIGRPGAVLSGSKILHEWRHQGTVWSARGFLPATPDTHGECVASAPTCAYTQDVFADKRRLARVGARSAVSGATMYADYRTGTITIGINPRSHLIEQAVAPGLVRATADDITVANLVLEEAANEAQTGAVESRVVSAAAGGGTGWHIIDNEVRLNHGVGLGFAGASTVTGNFIHDQGQLGFGAHGIGSVIANNEISFNGAAGYSSGWEAGGGKSWMTRRETLIHNYVHDNMGPGLWDDGGNIDTTCEYNKIDGNWGAGIQHEISYDATIEHNEISANGRLRQGWAWDAGIEIQSSGGTRLIEVAYNAVAANANGITVLDSGHRAGETPAPYGPHVVRNVWVHDNTVSMSAGQTTGAVEDDHDTAIFTSNHVRFDANTYEVDSLAAPDFSWGDTNMDWIGWRGAGNDRHGHANLADGIFPWLQRNFREPRAGSGVAPGRRISSY